MDVPDANVAVVLSGQWHGARARPAPGRILRKSGDKRAVLYELVTEARPRRTPANGGGSTVLTADLVNARRRGSELRLVLLDDAARARAVSLAERLVAIVGDHVGRTHEELSGALDAVDVEAGDYRLKDGLVKLLEDRCELEAPEGPDPEDLRRDVFTGPVPCAPGSRQAVSSTVHGCWPRLQWSAGPRLT